MTSAYPDVPVEVLDFCYKSALHLTRGIEAVQARRGEDANYVLSRTYEAAITVKHTGSDKTASIPVVVPNGFLTDLSSVPWYGRWAVSRVGPHLEASIVHDWLYVAWQKEDRDPTDDMRRFADDVFRQAMKEATVGSFKTWLIHLTVRMGGKKSFFDEDVVKTVGT